MNTQYEYPESYAKHPMTYSEGLGEQTIEEYCEMVERYALGSEQMSGMDVDEFTVLETVPDRDPYWYGLNHLEHEQVDEDSDSYKNYQRMCEMIQGCYAAMTEAYDSTYIEILGFRIEGPISICNWQLVNPFDQRFIVRVMFAGDKNSVRIPMSYFEETWGCISIMKKMAEDEKKKKEDDNE